MSIIASTYQLLYYSDGYYSYTYTYTYIHLTKHTYQPKWAPPKATKHRIMNGPMGSGTAAPQLEHVRIDLSTVHRPLPKLTSEGFMSSCCPCLLYGKVSSRMDDPALKEYSHMNGSVSRP